MSSEDRKENKMPRINIPSYLELPDRMEPVPEDWYRVSVTKAPDEKTSKNNNKMLNWQLGIMQGDHMGRLLFYTTMLEPAEQLWRFKAFMNACGVSGDESGVNTDDAVGCELMVRVVQRAYVNPETGETTTQNDVRAVKSL